MSDHDSLIVRLAARGDGVTGSGRHVAGAVPGDRLEEGGGLIWGPHHREPACRHAESCGGCQLQHADDAALADFVRDRVLGPLAGKGIVPDEVRAVHLSPPGSRRRAALRFERGNRGLRLGFSTAASHRIVDITACPVLEPKLFEAALAVRGFLSRWPVQRVAGTVQLTALDQGVDAVIAGIDPQGLAAHEALLDLARSSELARLSVDRGEGPETQWEPEPVTITLGGVAVSFPHGAFLQATADGEAALVAAAREALEPARTVADLFAGLGTFALSLVEPGRRILAAEAARDPILALRGAANRAQLPVFADHRDLFRNPLRAEELARFDGVVLDPPRAGAEAQVEQLAISGLPRICYVSCNPATFARDARVLVDGGYRLATVWPVGQFRWSTHVELASLFVR